MPGPDLANRIMAEWKNPEVEKAVSEREGEGGNSLQSWEWILTI